MAMFGGQLTIGAGGTTQLSTTSQPVKQIIFQNNAAGQMVISDKNVTSTRGIVLPVGGGSLNGGAFTAYNCDLKDFWVNGTATQKLDYIYFT